MPELLERTGVAEIKPFNRDTLLSNLSQAEAEWRAGGFPVAINSEKIKQGIQSHDTVVLTAETGSGKSAFAPALYLSELLKNDPDAKVLVTQPRRLATESVARFVGEQIGEKYVDFRFRGHGGNKPNARLMFTVEQSLLNDLVKDELLNGYNTVIIDEVHERSISIDTILPLLKRSQSLRKQKGIKPLKIVMASGTPDPAIEKYFQGAHIEHVEGRAFNVTEFFAGSAIPIEEMPETAAIKTQALFADEQKKGDALIFMPGRAEIEETIEALRLRIRDPNVEIVPIMGGDTENDPNTIIKNNPGNKRRIYVATNAAETSITIPGITMVIDSGLVRRKVFNPDTGLTTLETMEHAQANWLQRKGRAGRKQDGEAYALFTEEQYNNRPRFQQAQFLQSDLSSQILIMKSAGIEDVYGFEYIETPPRETIARGIASLQKLGALDKSGTITEIGREMAEIGEDPALSRMLVEGRRRNCLESVATAIGFMQSNGALFELRKNENLFQKFGRFMDPKSDFITALNVWNDFQAGRSGSRENRLPQNGINTKTLFSASKAKRELLQNPFFRDKKLRTNATVDIATDAQKDAVHMSIASGLMDRILVRDGRDTYTFNANNKTGIKLGFQSAFSAILPEKVLSGNIISMQKDGVKRIISTMNMEYAPEKLVSEFQYLAELMPKPKPEAPPAYPSEPVSTPHTHPSRIAQPNGTKPAIPESTIKTPSSREAVTFFQKIRKNWHTFTEQMKKTFSRWMKKFARFFNL